MDSNRMLREEKKRLDQQVQQLEAKVCKLEADIEPLQEENRSVTAERDALSADKISLTDKVTHGKQRTSHLIEQYNHLMEQYNRSDPEEPKRLKAEISRLNAQLIATSAEEDDNKKTFGNLSEEHKAEISRLNDQLSATSEENDTLRTKITAKNKEINNKSDTITQLVKTAQHYKLQCEDEREKQSKSNTEADAKIKELEEQLTTNQSQMCKLEADIEPLQEQNRTLTAERDALSADKISLTDGVTCWKQRTNHLIEEQKQLNKGLNTLKIEICAKNSEICAKKKTIQQMQIEASMVIMERERQQESIEVPRPPSSSSCRDQGNKRQREKSDGDDSKQSDENVSLEKRQRVTPQPTHQLPAPSFRQRPRIQDQAPKSRASRLTYYELLDILCLPFESSNTVTIPSDKRREYLANIGMSGKICIDEDMPPAEVVEEIASVFRGVFHLMESDQFQFDYLSVLPGYGEKLQRPMVSSNLKWSGQEVLSTCWLGCLYIMCGSMYDLTMEHECTKRKPHSEDLAIETSDDDSELSVDDLPDALQLKDTLQLQASRNSTVVQPDTPANQFCRHTQVASNSTSSEANNIHAYNPYTSLWVDSDQEIYDEDISIAIENSLQNDDQPSTSNDVTSLLTLSDVVSQYSIEEEDETQLMVINRHHLMKSVVYAVHSPNFKFDKLVQVEFVGEEGEDVGGPRREMFRFLMKAVVNEMGILEGKEGHLYFTHSVDLLEKETYLLAGKLVRWSITQGGPGLPVLEPALYNLMFGGDLKCTLGYECVTDYEVHKKLHRLATCKEEDFTAVSDSLADWAGDRGVTGLYSQRFAQRDQIVKDLVKQHIFYRAQSEILQFKKGLGNFTIALEQFPTVLKSLFTMEGHKPLTRDLVRQLSTVTWSPEGSNLRVLEEETVYSWEIFLQECQGGSARTSLQDVLVFITAADCIPPMGFFQKLSIVFYSPKSDQLKAYPTASTCALELQLPRGKGDPPVFQELMEEAIINSKRFGKL